MQDYKSGAMQFVSDHKKEIALATAALCGLGIYKFYTREPKNKQLITLIAKNPIIHLQCRPTYLKNFDISKTKIAHDILTVAHPDIETIDLSDFLENGRIYLVEQKKSQPLTISLIKMATSQENLDRLIIAHCQEGKRLSLCSRYKHSMIDGIVDCVIEYPQRIAFKHAEPVSPVLQQQ